MSKRVEWGALSVRERDALVARCVLGLPVGACRNIYWRWEDSPLGLHDRSLFRRRVPHLTTDMAAAWTVVEKLLEMGRWAKIEVEEIGTSVYLPGNETAEDAEAVLLPAPEAICIAALRACGVEVWDG